MAPEQKKRTESDDLLISDLNQRVDPDLLDDEASDLWRAIPYEAEGFSGVMLGTGGSADTPQIEITLDAKGLYRIWVGIYSFQSSSRLRLRLNIDLCCKTLPPTPRLDRISLPVLHEVMWREADLEGKSIILEGGHLPKFYPAALAYIRLEPIEAESETSEIRIEHPMAITEDGFGIFHEFLHNRPENLVEPLNEIPENSCMKMLVWGAADGDICNYPTSVGTCRGAAYQDKGLSRLTDNTYYANLRRWKENGWDSMVTVRDYCRTRGWEFHAYVRVEAFATQYPLTLTCGNRSKFFEENQHLCCRDKNGRQVLRLSYAYPEVQDHMLEIFNEISNYQPDGLCLAFIRGVPVVLYEDVMVDGFMDRYAIDPRELPETDPRWLRYQAEIVSGFMSKVRSLLRPNQRLSAIIPGNMADCARWGLNPAHWVQEQIVDDLFPTGQRFTPEDVHVDDPHNLDFRSFRQLHGKDDFRVIPMLYPWDLFSNDYRSWRKLIYEFLDAGADGYAVWDGNSSEDRFSRIGDIGLMPRMSLDTLQGGEDQIVENKHNKPEPVTKRLLTMNGYRFDRYHHFEVV
jgi:hypothetical protein